ncbi:hypothetical protein BH09PLA1_BH09PLA1_03010 [soil metagenome]
MNRRHVFLRRGENRTKLLFAAAAVAGFWPSADVLAVNTTFTNANNNLLWGDPGNWSNGVPTVSDQAIFPVGPLLAAVDLGGVGRSAFSTRFNAAGYTLDNGTLSTQSVNTSGDTTINAALTSPATSLRLQFSNAAIGALTINGSIFGAIDLEAHGVLAGDNTCTGRTRVDSIINFSGAGAAADSSQFVVPNGKLQLDYTLPAGGVNKIGDAAPINLFHSTLELNNFAGGPVNEYVGTITLLKSANVIRLTTSDASAGTLTLSHPKLIGEDFATALIDVDPARGTRFKPTLFTGDGGRVQNVIYNWLMGLVRPTPGALDGPLSFITYSDTRGMRPLDLATEYASSIDGSQSDTRLTTTQSLASGSSTVHSLALHGGSAGLQLNGTNLRITTAAMALSADASATGEILSVSGTGTLTTFTDNFVIWTDAYAANTHRYRIDVPINTFRLTKSGPGSLVLSRQNSINSQVILNDGTLVTTVIGALGNATVVGHAAAALRFEGVSQNANALLLDNAFSETIGTQTQITGFATTLDVAAGITAGFNTVNGEGTIQKVGPGRLRIGSGTVQLGSMTLTEGSLQVDGTFALVSPGGLLPTILANPNTTVLGNGTILANISAPIAPGVDGIGRLSVATLGLSAGSPAVRIELDGTDPGTGYDQLVVLNAANFQFRALEVDLLNGFTPSLGTQFTIIDDRFTGPITGTFNNLPQNAVFFADGRAFQINYLGGAGNDVVLTAVVPEPSSLIFVVAPPAIACLGSRRRRVGN